MCQFSSALLKFVSIQAQAGPKGFPKLSGLCMRPLDMLAPALAVLGEVYSGGSATAIAVPVAAHGFTSAALGARNFMKGGVEANNKGKDAETRTGSDNPADKERYKGPVTGKDRIADKSTKKTIEETKNVPYQYLSSQLKDGIQYAKDMGKKFILWLPKAANVSKPLKSAIDNKEVIRKNIPKGKKTS